MKHLEFEKLVKNFEGSPLSPADRREIDAHLELCAECAAKAAKLEQFFAYLGEADNAGRVSQADTARLLNIFRPTKTFSEKKESFGRRLLANLVFDDWQTAVQERLQLSDSRQMIYRAGEFEIDLRLRFAAGKCVLSGQVLPGCEGRSMAAEIFSDERNEKVLLNEYCEFVFPPVKEGIYNFRLDAGGEVIEIEKLSLLN